MAGTITIKDENRYALLYLNKFMQLKSIPITFFNDEIFFSATFCPPEDYVICGLIWEYNATGINGFSLESFMTLKPIEKYLLQSSNIYFEIPRTEYRTANVPVIWEWGTK